jgi:hypothetical protein
MVTTRKIVLPRHVLGLRLEASLRSKEGARFAVILG